MANISQSFEVHLSEMELDELSKECAAFVLEEPLLSTFDMATNQKQILGEQEDMNIDKENNLLKKLTSGNEHEGSFDYSRGTGVFIPISMNVKEPKPSKGTGVFINPHILDDHHKSKKDEKKQNVAHMIKKKKAGKQMVPYVQVLPNVSLPQEWPYEYSL